MFEKIFSSKKESSKSPQQPSRREFLHTGGAALVGLALFPRDAIAWAPEIKEGSTFEQGILQLRNEVINSPVELGAIWRVGKNGKGSWLKPTEGKGTEVPIDYDSIEFCMKQ